MVTQQILDYINAQLEAGFTKEQITEAMVTSGWNESDIAEAFATVERAPVASPEIPATMPNPQPMMPDAADAEMTQAESASPAAEPQQPLEQVATPTPDTVVDTPASDATSMAAVASMPRVGFGLRFLATLVDWILILIIGGVIAFFAGALIGHMFAAAGSSFGMIALFLGAIMSFAYGTLLAISLDFLLEALTGASLGKMILGLQIARPDGSAAALWRLILREVLLNVGYIAVLVVAFSHIRPMLYAGGLLQLIVIVGFFLVFGKARQTICDKVAGTTVFHRRDLPNTSSMMRIVVLLLVGVALLLIIAAGVLLKPTTTPALAPTTAGIATSSTAGGVRTVRVAPTATSTVSKTASSSVTMTTPAPTATASTNKALVVSSVSPAMPGGNMTISVSGTEPNTTYYIVVGSQSMSKMLSVKTPSSPVTSLTTTIPTSMFPCSFSTFMSGGCTTGTQVTTAAGSYQMVVKAGNSPDSLVSNTFAFTMSANSTTPSPVTTTQSSAQTSGAPVLISLSPTSGPIGTVVTVTGIFGKDVNTTEYYRTYFGNDAGTQFDRGIVLSADGKSFTFKISNYGLACSLTSWMTRSITGCSNGNYYFNPGQYKLAIGPFYGSSQAPFSNALNFTLTQ